MPRERSSTVVAKSVVSVAGASPCARSRHGDAAATISEGVSMDSATPLKGLAAADDAFLPGIDGGLCPVGEVQLAQDVADVAFDRVPTDHQLPGNNQCD